MVSGYGQTPPNPSEHLQLVAGALWLMIAVGALPALGAFGWVFP